MSLDSKKVVRSLKNGIVVLSIFCYRFACAHPIISSLLCSFGLLYVVYPEVFFFLVSSSPVLISTALLLGALLSLGQPHIPQIDDIEEEEENVEASSKSNEDVNEEKKNKVKETTDKDDYDDVVTQNLKGKTSAVKEVTVTKVSRRRFEEGIDDFSTRRYLDAESVLGKRTEIVETIEEEEEQFNAEELENDRDHIGCDVVGQKGGLMSILKEEEEKCVEIKNKAAASVDVPLNVVETDVHKEEENIIVVEDVSNASLNVSETDVHKEEENAVLVEDTPEKFQEKTTHEVAERQGILSMDKGEDNQMENHPISVHLSDTDTRIEGSHQKPVKEIAEIEEEMPLINHPSSSSLKLHEEISHSRIVDPDFLEGFLKSKCSEDEVQAEISNKEEEGAQKAPIDEIFSLSLQSSWKKFAHHRTFSDSGSDHAESSSADASLGDLGPMFDELHPLLDFEAPKAGSASDSSLEESEIIHEEGFSPRERTSEDLIAFPDEPQAQSDGHEEEEEEEENVPADFGFAWTEDDEINLRDLGYSERERVQLEEKVIALRHSQHHQEAEEANLMDFFSEERPSLLEEENLVEIGFLGHKNVKNAAENQSDSAGQVQSDSGYKDVPIEIQSDSVDEEKRNESTEEKSSGDHIMEQIHRDFLLQEDQSRGFEAARPSEIMQEETNIQVSSIESTSQNFTEEGLASKQEETQVGSPKVSLQSIETIELAELDSPTVIDMQRESLPDIANVASIEEDKSKTEESEETCDHSSSTLSSNKIGSTTVEAIAEELTSKHREFCLGFPEDSEQYLEMVEAIEPDTPPVMEIQRDSVRAAAEVASTEEHQLKDKKTEEASESTREIISEDSAIRHDEIQVGFLKASLESTETADAIDLHSPPVIEMQRDSVPAVAEVALIKREESDEHRIEVLSDVSTSEPRMKEVMAEDSACKHEEDQSDTPKVLQRYSAPAVAEEGSTEEQYPKEEKNEGPFDDSSSSTSEKFESIDKDDVVADKSRGKDEEIQSGSTKASKKPTDLDSCPVIEMHGDSVPTVEEEVPTEASELKLKGTEESGDGSESQQKLILLEAMSEEEVESAIKDVIAEELASGHEEVCVGSPKVSLESAEVIEPVELDSPPEIQMTRDSAPIVADVDSTEEQQSNMDETKESSDDSSSSASDISRIESLQELTILEVKFKEEILSAFKEAIAEESTSGQQPNMEEETKKSSDDSISSASDISMAESLQELTIPEAKSKEEILSTFKEVIAEESTSRQQSNKEESKKLSDDSSSSASDISMVESLQELPILEVKSKEGILSAFKEAIAEESTSKHEGIQVGSSPVSEHLAETVVELLNLESGPGIEMHRDILPAVLEVASTEENPSKPEKTEQPLLNARHSSSCGGGDIP